MVGGVGVALLLLIVGVGLYWLPTKIADQVVAVAEKRTGLKTSVASASAGLFSVTVHGLSLGKNQGVSFEVDKVVVPSSPITLALSGAEAIDRLELDGARLRVDLTHPNATELVDKFVRRSGRGAQGNQGRDADEEGRKFPALELRDLHVEVVDEHGQLISAQDVKLSADDGERRLTAKAVTLGQPPGDTLFLEELTLTMSPKLREVIVAAGRLTPAEGSKHERIAGRLVDLKERLMPAEAEPELANTSSQRITRAVIEKLTVMSSAEVNGSQEPLLEDLSILAERKPPKPWHLQGDGRPRGKGQLSWDVLVDREALTVRGDVHFDRLPLSVITPFLPNLPWYRPEATSLSADLKVHEASAAEASFEGRLAVDNLGLESERIASAPVSGVSFVVESRGKWQTAQRKLTIETGTLQVERAKVQFSGSAHEDGSQWGFDLTASLPPTPCGDAVGAIPTDLLAEISGFSWRGQIAGTVRATADSEKLDDAKLRIDVEDGCTFESAPSVAELARYKEPFTHRVLESVDEEGREDWFEMSAGPGTSNWTSIWDMSPFFVHAVLAHEDASFFRHAGFAPWAIDGAFRRNLKARRYVVGASTISMQLSKNLFLHREKTLARKAQEVILTWWVENRWDKRSILEMYLNVIEYGPRIYGITEAADYYFGRHPSELSLAESAFLATILPNPKKFHASYARGSLNSGVANKMRFLIRHMGRKNRIDAVAVEHGLQEVDRFRFQSPDQASPPGPRTFVGAAASLPYMVNGQFASPIATEDMIWDDEPEGDAEPASPSADDQPQVFGW